jgi:hypothetical protein
LEFEELFGPDKPIALYDENEDEHFIMPSRGFKIDKDKPKYEDVSDLDLPSIPKSGTLALVKMEDIVPTTPTNLVDDSSIQILSENEKSLDVVEELKEESIKEAPVIESMRYEKHSLHGDFITQDAGSANSMFTFGCLHSTKDSKSIENFNLRSTRAPVITDATVEYLGEKISDATISQELINVALKEFDEVISGMEKSINPQLSPEDRQKIDKACEKLNKARMEINSARKDIDLISEDIKVEADRRQRYQSVSSKEATTVKPTKRVQYQDNLIQPDIDTSVYMDIHDFNHAEESAMAIVSLPLPTDHERVDIRNIPFSYNEEQARVAGKCVFTYRDYPHPPMYTNGITYHNSDKIPTKSLRTLIRNPHWINNPASLYSLPPLFLNEEKAKQNVMREMKSEYIQFLPHSDYVHKVTGDGNCLFNAIALGIYDDEDHQSVVREQLADLLENEAMFYKLYDVESPAPEHQEYFYLSIKKILTYQIELQELLEIMYTEGFMDPYVYDSFYRMICMSYCDSLQDQQLIINIYKYFTTINGRWESILDTQLVALCFGMTVCV